ncbi:related to diacylglycerol pyrophosphate phosphatase [Rhynchosporium agropyri]|uniref:Related to diacylglycerol pyrophosphate phosphatase n=1 Tax=Rhynchosporium agropyri TaxID=914238 RepID=A0A1E1KU05_9HELO|nr:related to diacylglycerol pyrophosphate phosphatase [Rhynchosporium agropyri]
MRQDFFSRATNGGFSKLLVVSYVLDWVIIIVSALVGAILAHISPNKRPFSLTNAEISFPHVEHEKVPLVALGCAGLVGPAVIIFLVCLILVPGPTVSKSIPKSLIFKRKLWEWHQGWMGLALSLAASFLITSGMKNLFGKPRPDLLSRCEPDMANLANYTYSKFLAGSIYENFNVVSAKICQQSDKAKLDDGFRSFPSGHASFSSGGLVYLSLFLASKLAITIPFLAAGSSATQMSAFPSRATTRIMEQRTRAEQDKPIPGDDLLEEPSGHDDKVIAARNQAAGPPVYLLVITVLPFFASIYIASTRYSDFRHHGFDIMFGYLIGTVTSIFAFRYYHLPINQGAGWSWGPRSRDRSFWAGVGVGNYVGSRERTPSPEIFERTNSDMEAGRSIHRNHTNEVGNSENTAYTGIAR